MKKILAFMLPLMIVACTATEKPETMKVTVKYDCPVQEGIVTHIKDSVRFSDTTASFMLVRGQQYRLYAEAFDENSTMYMCDTTFIASDSFIVCKLHEVSTITIQLDTAWIRTEPHTW